MITILINAFVSLCVVTLGYLFLRKKNKAETESFVVEQYDKLAKQQRTEIEANAAKIEALEKKYEACEYDHLVKTLELAHIKRQIDLHKFPKACVFVLDDNKMVTMEFKKYFRDISVLDCRTFFEPKDFLIEAKKEHPEILILDHFLSDSLTADDVIKELDYLPEIFIMSQDKDIHILVREKGWDFFYKDDNYVRKIAKAVIEYLYHKT